MKRRLCFIVCLALALVLCLGVFSACKKPVEEVTVTSLEITKLPNQYFQKGDRFGLDGGELLVTYSDGSTKTVLMTDDGVTATHPGTGVSGILSEAVVYYGGKGVVLKYYVSDKKIIDVSIVGEMPTQYAVGGKPRFSNIKVSIKYEDEEVPKEFWLTSNNTGTYSESFFSSNGLTLSGFDTAKVGDYSFTIGYLAETFKFNYSVVQNDWIVSARIMEDVEKKYFIGEELDFKKAYMKLTYSKGTTQNYPLSKDMVTGFSTEQAGSYTMQIKHPNFETPISVNYSVSARENIVLVVSYAGDLDKFVVGYDFGDFKAYIKDIKIDIYKDEVKYKTIYGNNEDITVSCEGKPLSETVNSTLGRDFTIDVTYCGLYTQSYNLSIRKSAKSMELLNFDTIKLNYVEGESFDFGDAKIIIHYDDGTAFQYTLQNQYEANIADRGIGGIGFMNKYAVDVNKFDMSAGSHTKEYYIRVTENVFDESKPETAVYGRYYLNYTVTAAPKS